MARQGPPALHDHIDFHYNVCWEHQLMMQATVVWNGWQLRAFKQFLISQLRDLMEGLTSPAVLEKQLDRQKYYKQLGLKNMVMPETAAGADRQASHSSIAHKFGYCSYTKCARHG